MSGNHDYAYRANTMPKSSSSRIMLTNGQSRTFYPANGTGDIGFIVTDCEAIYGLRIWKSKNEAVFRPNQLDTL